MLHGVLILALFPLIATLCLLFVRWWQERGVFKKEQQFLSSVHKNNGHPLQNINPKKQEDMILFNDMCRLDFVKIVSHGIYRLTEKGVTHLRRTHFSVLLANLKNDPYFWMITYVWGLFVSSSLLLANFPSAVETLGF